MRLYNILKNMAAKLKDFSDRINASTIGTRTDISNYTSSNMYTCPSDGYVFMYCATSSTIGIVFLGTIAVNLGGNLGRYSLFVKKGTKLYVEGSPSIAAFVPISGGVLKSLILSAFQRERWCLV